MAKREVAGESDFARDGCLVDRRVAGGLYMTVVEGV